ncbi:hypothetical protein M427DRAFT_51334 [Gonapodya prolifera JEL478]|uniref:SH3 domain-containing protein n=1 Tax=Gonapodya prolifera (strain JEL478) TaxID=1344416 RepID=A0A139AZQ9_GONPJ|nr:hypothetical protein M427DRAFT_51334 [Gonapodya prolifera JEL478]|eukprot:KXS21965.1 hypothetical protein M427DRAFT_51334 [Gonapodya prolifera JEL478]
MAHGGAQSSAKGVAPQDGGNGVAQSGRAAAFSGGQGGVTQGPEGAAHGYADPGYSHGSASGGYNSSGAYSGSAPGGYSSSGGYSAQGPGMGDLGSFGSFGHNSAQAVGGGGGYGGQGSFGGFGQGPAQAAAGYGAYPSGGAVSGPQGVPSVPVPVLVPGSRRNEPQSGSTNTTGSTAVASGLYERLGGRENGQGVGVRARTVALAEWRPQASDELLIAEGDEVNVETVFADNWCFGHNMTRSGQGVFPAAILGDAPFGLSAAPSSGLGKVGPRVASRALGPIMR